ncbi:MAG: YbgC/FadM family acyl-CoA thioesterase [Candidatus Omnitrophica bacterium]|jgi:acyl-CoA thioester hydrolase|nr:YbgC/FadM family acyl-CoA thioesterase [Candidatus Omnitrophota bacterium]
MKVRVYYHDTDCGGVVYYANYLKYMEQARTEFLESRQINMKALVEQGTYFVVAHQEIDYKLPARYGDILEISSRLIKISTVKLEYEHEVNNQNGQLVCKGKAVLVCVDSSIKPKAIPEDIKSKLGG